MDDWMTSEHKNKHQFGFYVIFCSLKMSAKAIREATGKEIINRHLAGGTAATSCRFASVDSDTKFSELVANNPWLKTEKLVVKPDQLIKRRGKLGRCDILKNIPFTSPFTYINIIINDIILLLSNHCIDYFFNVRSKFRTLHESKLIVFWNQKLFLS